VLALISILRFSRKFVPANKRPEILGDDWHSTGFPAVNATEELEEKGRKGAAHFELWLGWLGLVEAYFSAAPFLTPMT